MEITVRHTQLRSCEKNERLCVTSLRDCDLRPPLSLQKALDVTCYYQEMTDRVRSVTCAWGQESQVQPDSSLIFSSGSKITWCGGVFNPAAVLNVTVRMKDYETGGEIWSRPQTVFLFAAVKPSQAVLTVLASTEDSLVVSWKSSVDGLCRLRYRPIRTHQWTQNSDVVAAHADQDLKYTIRNLLPFNVYRASVACRGELGFWSEWSSGTTGRTLDRVPSRPSEVCYRVETNDAAEPLLHLRWKAPDPGEPQGRVLGYQVIVNPRLTQNVTETSALLLVEEGDYSASVQAFNTAGLGPAARLHVNTKKRINPPSVQNLWISSHYPQNKLVVQWALPPSSSSAPLVSHATVEWCSKKKPSSRNWTSVEGLAASAVIRDVEPEESYLVSVFLVYHQQCGSPQSLTASLQQGALVEAINLNVASVTKTTVTVMWAWQQKSGPIRVKRYRVMLRRDADTQTLSLWPDQQQHTFFNLTPNTEYALLLLADDVSRSIITVTTRFDEVPAVATATPLLLLAVTMMIISVLSRTVYKSYFFPPISSPRLSSTGRWLMSPNPKKYGERNTLDMKDFEVTDLLENKRLVGSSDQSSDDLREVVSPLPISIQTSAISLSVGDAGPIRELLAHQPYGPINTDLTCDMEYLMIPDDRPM
ncbi:interleukin-6 receptor subunit beta [Nematolebias whitei]|uniref:interleukin-6 receptor subunit beta n=1 Tax=Nematolebias whitei TaxID=451745 RepID=UPI00189B3FB0|nr:interleukin-6 receptor subunit beta [Nematolebias whitei]